MNTHAAQIIRPEILAIGAYPVPDATGCIKLDAMENPYELPPELRTALAHKLAAVALNRYPLPTSDALRARIREVYQVPAGSELMLGNGSDELISLIALACARPGAALVSLAPTFVMYEVSAKFAGLRYVPVTLNADFTLDLPRLLGAIAEHKPAIVYLAYPNNPTGTLYPRAAIEAVLHAAPGLVVIDEAYNAFASDSFMRDLLRWPNLIVMRTVSKSGLAGTRLGYMAGHPDWLREFDKVRAPYNVNVLTQTTVEFALEHHEVLDEQAARLRAERPKLAAALAALPGVEVFPSDANFILFRVADAGAVFDRLKSRKVLIKFLGKAHPLLANCLRVTVSSPEENAAFLAALRASL